MSLVPSHHLLRIIAPRLQQYDFTPDVPIGRALGMLCIIL